LTLKRPDQFCDLDPGICGHLTRRNLGWSQSLISLGF
jgi:hypothetical protein